MMNKSKKPFQINRRAFLTGAGGIAIGLPFLEGLPSRSAWAAGDNPIFSFFIVQANGVIQEKFWPSSAGALSAANMAGMAVEPLAPFAANLLIVKGIKHPGGNPGACGHAQGYVQSLTGVNPGSEGNSSTSGGPSVDVVISKALNPSGVDPITLYSGVQQGAFIAERISFTGAKVAARPAQLNPYETYKRITGVVSQEEGGGEQSPTSGPTAVDDLLLRKKSVNDVVLAEFQSLLARKELSAEDKRRLTNHMDGIRNLENNLMSTGGMMNDINDGNGNMATCSISPSALTALDAYKNGVKFDPNSHMIEDLVKLHAETVALSFACGQNRTATLQWGAGTDGTVYDTVSKGGYNTFHKLSHQTNSDATAGNDSFAKEAHREIDIIRMKTFAAVLQTFSDRGLFDNSFIYLTNSIAIGTSHTYNPIPVIIAGNAGGFFKQGQFMDAGGKTNAPLMASLLTAAGVPTDNFGAGGGQLTSIHAG